MKPMSTAVGGLNICWLCRYPTEYWRQLEAVASSAFQLLKLERRRRDNNEFRALLIPFEAVAVFIADEARMPGPLDGDIWVRSEKSVLK